MPVCFIGYFNEQKNKFFDILSRQEFVANDQRIIQINGKTYEDIIISNNDTLTNGLLTIVMRINGSILDGTEYYRISDFYKHKELVADYPGLIKYFYSGTADSTLSYKDIKQIEYDIKSLIKTQLNKQKEQHTFSFE